MAGHRCEAKVVATLGSGSLWYCHGHWWICTWFSDHYYAADSAESTGEADRGNGCHQEWKADAGTQGTQVSGFLLHCKGSFILHRNFTCVVVPIYR